MSGRFEASWEVGLYQVDIEAEACVIQCEITNLVTAEPQPGAWSSDWDAVGYHELEFRVVSGQACDTDGTSVDLGRNGCAELAERYAEYIEAELWRHLNAQQLTG